MKLIDYIYYCTYRFMLRTPLRKSAQAWSIGFLGLTIVIHAIALVLLFTTVAKIHSVPLNPEKIVSVTALVLLNAFFFWHYIRKGNGARVIADLAERGNEKMYARTGAILFIETAFLPMALVGLLLISSRLFGWPDPIG